MGNVMVGIAEALIATGVGLVVAIPAVVAFNIVNKSISSVESNVSIMAKYVAAQLLADKSDGGPPLAKGGAPVVAGNGGRESSSSVLAASGS